MTDPTLGEVMRRLDETATDLAAVAADMKAERERTEKVYVRHDVWTEARRADRAEIAQLKKSMDDDAKWRRQVLLGLGLTALSSLTALGIALLNAIAGRG